MSDFFTRRVGEGDLKGAEGVAKSVLESTKGDHARSEGVSLWIKP